MKFLNAPFVSFVSNEIDLPDFIHQLIDKRVITNAANTEVKIPMINVVAKDSIGPEPNVLRITAVNKVVMLASKIDDKAFLNPVSTADLTSLPAVCSSRIRSKISTLASTAIPIVKTIPAIPAKLNTAPKDANEPKMNKIFANKAISAIIPALP